MDEKPLHSLVSRLAVPDNPSQVRVTFRKPSNTPERVAAQSQVLHSPKSLLMALPDELLLEIFRQADFVTVFRLSLASRRLWDMGWPALQLKVSESVGTWAGARLFHLSETCKAHDLPAGFLTREEETEFGFGLQDDDFQSWAELDRFKHFYGSGPAKLAKAVRDHFRLVKRRIAPQRMLLEQVPGSMRTTALDEARCLPKADRHQTYKFARGKTIDFYPMDEAWVLRNLTSKDFVRGSGLSAAFPLSGVRNGPHLGYPGFGEAIIGRIGWASPPTPLPPWARSLGPKRGVWAGHRFEIRTERYHASHSNDEWQDVTGEIIKELSTT